VGRVLTGHCLANVAMALVIVDRLGIGGHMDMGATARIFSSH